MCFMKEVFWISKLLHEYTGTKIDENLTKVDMKGFLQLQGKKEDKFGITLNMIKCSKFPHIINIHKDKSEMIF